MRSFLKIIGFILIFSGLALVGLIYYPVLEEEAKYRLGTIESSREEIKEIIPADEGFALLIPKIGVNVKVFANVDATNPKEYLPLLAQGVAHAKGSFFPGQNGNVFIFAHSTNTPLNANRYNAVFYLLNKLEKDDEIVIYYEHQKYVYKVEEKKIISPEQLNNFLKNQEGETLILQTCWPPGTTLKRLMVVAKEAGGNNIK